MLSKFVSALAFAALLPASSLAADIVVINADPPGQGFNDPTPAAPVGGNPGSTVGEQALYVFQRAADLWGKRLQSTETINIVATFTPLNCNSTGAVLGSAGAYWYFRDAPPEPGFPGMKPGTWYHAALAEKLTGVDLTTSADPNASFEIITFFNSRLGQPGCLDGSGWYYGIDNQQPGNRIDLLAVVLHEFGHGLGFSLGVTSSNTGSRAQGLPSVWEGFMYDVTAGKTWLEMTTNAERAASARNDGNLVWIGKHANNVIPSVLDREIMLKTISPTGIPSGAATPATAAARIQAPGKAVANTLLAPADGGGASPNDGCEPFPAPGPLVGYYVLVDRGGCPFNTKAANAYQAGAAGLLIANNAAGLFAPVVNDGPGVNLPVFGISQSLGGQLRAAATVAPASIELSANARVRTGTTAGFPRLYAPLTFASGSSVSHWDITASPSLLMEPSITPALTSSVKNPEDLSRGLLRDIGW